MGDSGLEIGDSGACAEGSTAVDAEAVGAVTAGGLAVGTTAVGTAAVGTAAVGTAAVGIDAGGAAQANHNPESTTRTPTPRARSLIALRHPSSVLKSHPPITNL
jgi:hypothetical protein